MDIETFSGGTGPSGEFLRVDFLRSSLAFVVSATAAAVAGQVPQAASAIALVKLAAKAGQF